MALRSTEVGAADAAMQNLMIVSSFFILISLGLLMVIMGQQKEMEILTKKNEALTTATNAISVKLQYEINFKKSLQDIKTSGDQRLQDMEANLPKLTKQLEDKKSEDAACQQQIHLFIVMLGMEPVLLETTKAELASLEETLKSTTATFNAESEVWKQEIISLNAKLSAPSPICKYVTSNETLV
ncbi:hypothetical protein CCH79_00008702 [Gambusia affinis]|uniref:Uncharacterized protein n=1 Tax=Gambusia affinis TaxID=33528 RepID=A0A315UUT0_GAMAF|nr:hypothetical protein CCH79_00008702 [Gambusia affinis]